MKVGKWLMICTIGFITSLDMLVLWLPHLLHVYFILHIIIEWSREGSHELSVEWIVRKLFGKSWIRNSTQWEWSRMCCLGVLGLWENLDLWLLGMLMTHSRSSGSIISDRMAFARHLLDVQVNFVGSHFYILFSSSK
jgi:hypothetical protein